MVLLAVGLVTGGLILFCLFATFLLAIGSTELLAAILAVSPFFALHLIMMLVTYSYFADKMGGSKSKTTLRSSEAPIDYPVAA